MNNKKSQLEIDEHIRKFFKEIKIKGSDDLITLRSYIQQSLKYRQYNQDTKKHADSIQWTRTASEIIQDGYVYDGKACSDLTLVYLAACKLTGLEHWFVKLINTKNKNTHSIAEIKIGNIWYRFDPSMLDSVPFKGQLMDNQIWNKEWIVWKRGKDLWDLGFKSINDEKKIYK